MSRNDREPSPLGGCFRCYWSDRCGCGVRCPYFDPIEVTLEEENDYIDSVKESEFKIYEEVWDEYIREFK